MPLPQRESGESRADFLHRCMGDAQTVKDFGDAKQRYAVCEHLAGPGDSKAAAIGTERGQHMGEELNPSGVAHAHSLVASGAVDRESGWSFSAEDGDALLGPNRDDWARYGQYHLGINTSAADKTKAHWSYPFGKLKGGKTTLYRSAVTAIRQRAGQQGASAIEAAAGRLLEEIDKKSGQASGLPSRILGIGTVLFQAEQYGGDGPDTDTGTPKGTPRRPSFQIHGYTGASMALDGFQYPVVVDLNGIRPPSPTLPVLRQHDPNRIVGQAQVTKIDVSGVHLNGIVTGDDKDAKDVVEHAKNGFMWQASIGADIERREFLERGKNAIVNGREMTGPMHIVRQATLKEVSFVPIGADGATSAAVAASASSGPALKGSMSLFDTWLQLKGFDPSGASDEQRAALRPIYEREYPHV